MGTDRQTNIKVSLAEYKRLKWALYCLEHLEENDVDNWENFSLPEWNEFEQEFEADLEAKRR